MRVVAQKRFLEARQRTDRGLDRRQADESAVAGGVNDATGGRRDHRLEQVAVPLLQPLASLVAGPREVGRRANDVAEGKGERTLETPTQNRRQLVLEADDLREAQ